MFLRRSVTSSLNFTVIRTILIPLLAVAGIIFAALTVVRGSVPPSAQPPVIEPPRPPFTAFVAGSGLIEASSENIEIGAPVGALVTKVFVNVGDVVKAGDPLFQLDTRELDAELLVRESSLKVAQAQLDKLRKGTRPELIPPQRAKVLEAQSALDATTSQIADAQSLLDDAKAQVARTKGMAESGAMSAEEITRRNFAASAAQARLDTANANRQAAVARLEEAKSQLTLLEAGTWDVDLHIAESQVSQAQAAIDSLKIEIARRTVKSPTDAKILQKNILEGEFAAAGALATPLMLVGKANPLHVRVDIDEYEAWRVKPSSSAVAFARGNKNISAQLTFVRVEPYIVPKRSLTGAAAERVDTRVLQVLFSFDPKDLPLYVGQQVDVYIESEPVTR